MKKLVGEYQPPLGHGIGMDVHEFPSIMEGNDWLKKECASLLNQVFTFLKSWCSYRGLWLCDKDGFEVFTHTKELLYFDVN
ncbi:MAG: hypothetical protein ACLS6Y_06725 [Streptococcus salivarius]